MARSSDTLLLNKLLKNSKVHDFLFELGVEELPAKGLKNLAETFCNTVKIALEKAQLPYHRIQYFVTPRRLAILITQLAAIQPAQLIERRGPALAAAFDAEGNPTKATEGFARSCGVSPDQLRTKETEQGTWLFYQAEAPGKSVQEIMPELLAKALAELPVPKPMRWGDQDIQFIRPVHWLVMLYGKEVVRGKILGLTANHVTYGHRFHHNKAIPLIDELPRLKINNTYSKILEETGQVLADFEQRRLKIQTEILAKAQACHGEAIIHETLLDEVTGLVEWPVVLLAAFDKQFLAIPKEALITAMEHHQKCFPVENAAGELLPYFIVISNIESTDPQQVIHGNERVMRARLADAGFFYRADCQITLIDRLENLKQVIFQAKLGSLYDKSQRLAALMQYISGVADIDASLANRAGWLAKTDLVTSMVNEFPELQGIMGYYYARHDKEPDAVAVALREHYYPRFAGDILPPGNLGAALALVDRIDVLIGIFGIKQLPTGDKDPFGLRRAALGVARILIDKKLALDLQDVLKKAAALYSQPLENTETVTQVFDFILERLRAWYQEQGVTADVFAAVRAHGEVNLYYFDLRIKAVMEFRKLPQAAALAEANKRVKNLLAKEGLLESNGEVNLRLKKIDPQLFETAIENQLNTVIDEKYKILEQLLHKSYGGLNFTQALIELSALQLSVNQFFDQVMVMVEQEALRNNRLGLLAKLRNLFLNVADISLLQ